MASDIKHFNTPKTFVFSLDFFGYLYYNSSGDYMKSFIYKHSVAVFIMLSVIFILSGVGVYFNVISAIDAEVAFKKVSYAVLATICVLLDAVVLSIIFFSRYSIKGNILIVRMGIVRVKHDIKEILALVHAKKSDKLVAQFSDQSFAVIVISQKYYDEFFKAIKNVNPAVIFSVDYTGTENGEE